MKIKLTGNDYMFLMVWGSAVGLVLMAYFFPHIFDKPLMPEPKAQPQPWWGLMAMSAPVFLVWCHFLFTEIKRIIKKHGRHWWKIKIK